MLQLCPWGRRGGRLLHRRCHNIGPSRAKVPRSRPVFLSRGQVVVKNRIRKDFMVRRRRLAPAVHYEFGPPPRFCRVVEPLARPQRERPHGQHHGKALAAGDVLDVDFSVSRRGPVQVINSTGTGLGTLGSGDLHGGIVRGSWRLRFGASAWSDVLPVHATAADVHAQLDALQTCDAVGVDRNAYGAGGYAWSVTFYEAAAETWPLLGVDDAEVYTTNDDASFTVERRSGREHHAFWYSPSRLRVVVDDASDAASAAAVKAGAGVAVTLRVPLANAAAFFPTASGPTAATWSRR
ncbi:hypothetical protein M885DRAFT_228838 [Pelagophyceae sp. CCMP2097]|nr:hypothetical protein M885DRAFT_228838 [Pelagophyceae sp. CCMP2097]